MRKFKWVNKQLEILGKFDIKVLFYVNDGNCYLGSCLLFFFSCVIVEIINIGFCDWIMVIIDEED